jgi:hypothetical protein
MSTIDEREKGYEARFAHDQELAFKVAARRDKLLGLWAAKHLGLTGAAAEAYAKDTISADLERPGDDDVIEKVAKDFAAKGIAIGAARISDELKRCETDAYKQITSS